MLFITLYTELEKSGYIIPDKSVDGKAMMPDISVGLTFANYMKRNNSPFYGSHKKYLHTLEEGRDVEANMYPIEAYPTFHRFIYEVWIPEYAERYFKKRDPLALGYIPKLLKNAA